MGDGATTGKSRSAVQFVGSCAIITPYLDIYTYYLQLHLKSYSHCQISNRHAHMAIKCSCHPNRCISVYK